MVAEKVERWADTKAVTKAREKVDEMVARWVDESVA